MKGYVTPIPADEFASAPPPTEADAERCRLPGAHRRVDAATRERSCMQRDCLRAQEPLALPDGRPVGRSAMGTSSSSPVMETSRRALTILRLDEKSRYTAAGGTSDTALIASIGAAP